MKGRILENIKIQLRANKTSYIWIGIILVFVITSMMAFLSPYDPDEINISNRLSPPSTRHLFGTDDLGRDYFTRALYGGRVSLTVGITSMIISVVTGTIVGAASGYYGGVVDNIIMRIIDILMSIPSFFLILIANAYLSPGIITIILIIGFLSWMGTARIVRSETLSLKEREYILCSKVMGGKSWWILVKHIIPNIMPTVIVASTINIASAILTESSLSFLGLGVQQPKSSWGSMLKSAQGYMDTSSYMAIFPGMLILLTVLSFNVLGDLLRVAFDSKESQ